MEEKVDLLDHRFPSEDLIVEVVNSNIEVALKNVLLESVTFPQIDPVDCHLQNWNEYVSSCVQQIKR